MKLFIKSHPKAKRGNVRRNNKNRPRPHRGPGRKTNGSGQGLAIAAAIAVPTTALGIAGYAAMTMMSTEEPDANHCYAREDQHQAVIFVDNSIEGQSGSQLRDYRTAFIRAYDNAPANSLIKITSTARTQGGSFAQPSFVICKPASTPAEQEAIGAPAQPAPMLARIAATARGEYEAMVDQVIADAQDASQTAKDSPIFEQFQAISNYDDFTGPNRSLTSITDGVSNSDSARFCFVKGDLVSFDQFKERRSYQYVEPRSFEGVDVTLLLVEIAEFPVPEAPYCSNADIRDFWTDYFKANGAKSVDLRRLRYWQDS